MDSFAHTLLRLVHRTQKATPASIELATVEAYNPTTHRVRVRMQPDGPDIPDLQVGTHQKGSAHPVDVGSVALVAVVRGKPTALVCVLHSDNDVLWDAAERITGDVSVTGTVSAAGGFQLGLSGNLPTPAAAYRGQLITVAPTPDGVAGTADQTFQCLQGVDGVLRWKLIVAG